MRPRALIAALALAACEPAPQKSPEDAAASVFDAQVEPDAAASPPDASPEDAAAPDPDAQVGPDAAASLPVSTVEYRLAWDLGRVTPDPDAGWSTTNDQGQTIHVTRGWISSHSARLVLCRPVTTGFILNLLGIGTAWAGHDEGTPDTSTTPVGTIEDLANPEPSVLGRVLVTDTVHGPYCHVHYGVSRALEDATGLPEEQRMVGVSIHLEGTAARPGEAPVPFTVHTSYATGAEDALRPAPGADAITIDPVTQAAVVTITRDLGALFDGVDMVGGSDRERVTQVLYNLADTTVLTAEPITP